jgi:hypothetical protein
LTKKIPETAWAAELHRFSSRNAGRVTTLEVDRLNFQPGPNDAFPLRGISYDAHDDRVLITLGRNASGPMHTIARATGIYLLVDTRGRDEALAISQEDSSTVLRFVDL